MFIEALEKAELSRMSEEAQANYFAELKAYRDHISIFKTGIQDERLLIAKRCLENGVSIEMTAKLTGLTEDEVQKLQHN